MKGTELSLDMLSFRDPRYTHASKFKCSFCTESCSEQCQSAVSVS